MGFFDLFKKKKSEPVSLKHSFEVETESNKIVKVDFSGIQSAPSEHTTWNKYNGNSNNEYANAVFLFLHKGTPHKMDSVAHLSWLSYKLGIFDVTQKYKDLLQEGYFRESRPDEILNTYRVPQLKEIMLSYNIAPRGKKADMISSLLDAVPSRKLNLPKLYCLSQKGFDYVKEHEDLIDLFKNPYQITYDEYMAEKEKTPYKRYNDIIWCILNKREVTFASNEFMLRYRNREYRADFLKIEKKYIDALQDYLSVIYYEVNRISNDYKNILNSNRNRAHDMPELKISEHLANKAFELREYYSRKMVGNCIKCSPIPQKHIGNSDFQTFIDCFFSNGETDFSRYIK